MYSAEEEFLFRGRRGNSLRREKKKKKKKCSERARQRRPLSPRWCLTSHLLCLPTSPLFLAPTLITPTRHPRSAPLFYFTLCFYCFRSRSLSFACCIACAFSPKMQDCLLICMIELRRRDARYGRDSIQGPSHSHSELAVITVYPSLDQATECPLWVDCRQFMTK